MYRDELKCSLFQSLSPVHNSMVCLMSLSIGCIGDVACAGLPTCGPCVKEYDDIHSPRPSDNFDIG